MKHYLRLLAALLGQGPPTGPTRQQLNVFLHNHVFCPGCFRRFILPSGPLV